VKIKIKQMKKIFLFFLIISVTIGVNAQLKKSTPAITQKMEGKIASLPPDKRTDLALSITSIEDNSTPRQNQYTVHYTITNVGTEDINRYVNGHSIALSGYFSGPSTEIASLWGNMNGAASNFPMVALEDTHNSSSVLKPGESSRGTVKICKFNPSPYDYSVYLNPVNYKFLLKLDSKDEISESNEDNNTAQIQLPLHRNTDADLFLTGVTVIVQTGNDNKEANNSDVTFSFSPYQVATNYELSNYRNEIKVNSASSIKLESKKPILNPQNSLEFYKQKGFQLMIKYYNRVFHTDAWKINNVSLKLEFKDKYGNDPRIININFPDANGLLGYRLGDDMTSSENQKRWLILHGNGSFNQAEQAVFMSCFCNQ
jgi:hypothetical protein